MYMVEFDSWVRKILRFEKTDRMDMAMNGLQIGRSNSELTGIAFAVDACMDSLKHAHRLGMEALFVHHGLFWGKPLPLTGFLGDRVRFLMNNDMALYAVHLPLDAHEKWGNNAQIADAMGLRNIQAFGDYKGQKIGFKGILNSPATLEEIIIQLFGSWNSSIKALRFGSSEISSVGIISGGGPGEVFQAISEDLDLYITGDASHNIYHECQECGINVVFAGHYLSEVFGVKAMAKRVSEELKLKTEFIDIPTEL